VNRCEPCFALTESQMPIDILDPARVRDNIDAVITGGSGLTLSDLKQGAGGQNFQTNALMLRFNGTKYCHVVQRGVASQPAIFHSILQ
jgi:hypothetical protein